MSIAVIPTTQRGSEVDPDYLTRRTLSEIAVAELQSKTVHPPPKGKITGILLMSVTIACMGNSFLYGYQIGVINQPAKLIKDFYNKTFYERSGKDWEKLKNYESYVQLNMSDVEAIAEFELKKHYPDLSNTEKNLQPKDFGADLSCLYENWRLELLWSSTVAMFVFFGMIGAFLSARVADLLGRKRGMIVITSVMFLAAIIGGVSKKVLSPECLIFSRVLVGLHSGLNISLAPLYFAEISPQHIRGAIGTCHQLAITIGILVSQIFGLPDLLGTQDLWPLLFAFNCIPALICLVGMPFCPESPRWLLIKMGQEDEAQEALKKFRGTNDVYAEIHEMRIEQCKAMGVKNYTIKQLLTASNLRMPIIIACVLQITQQWSGINAVMSYSTILFAMVSIPVKTVPYLVVATGVINVACTIVCVPLMEKAGRRPLLIYPTILMLISFILMTIFLNLSGKDELESSKTAFAAICIVLMHTYIIGFAFGLGPIPFIVVGEIFTQEPRAAAMSLSLACNWICNFLLMITFPFLRNLMAEFVYLLFDVVLILALIFIFIFVPETKNRSFEEIADSINRFSKRNKQ